MDCLAPWVRCRPGIFFINSLEGLFSLKPVRQSCTLRPEVLKGDLQDAIFAADFGHVIEGVAPDVYQNPVDFFHNTHPAAPLKKVITTVFGRLADPTEAGAAIRLSTGFGGGKTHTLIALFHLAKNITQATLGTELLAAAGRPSKVIVAGIDGEKSGAIIFARHPDVETHSLWGELAYQLGGKAGYDAVASIDNPETAPDSKLIRDSLPVGVPVLILLDELVKYMAKLTDLGCTSLLTYIGALISEVGARKQAVLVITDPASQVAYQQASEALAEATRKSLAANWLSDELGRKMSNQDPIGDEAAQVIVRRLFTKVDRTAAEEASAEYYNTYKRVAADLPEALPTDASTKDYAKRIVDCYPFHPRLLDTAQNRLGALQDFNKTRGTLRLFARILRDIWEGEAEIPLVTAGDLDWRSARIQADLLNRLNRDQFKASVDADVVQHAGQLDKDFSTDIHRRVASALLLESLPLAHNAAMDKRDLTLSTLRPTDAGHEAGEAIDRLYSVCWHTYKDETGLKFQFRYEPNVNKLIEERAQMIPLQDARQAVLARAQSYFGGHTFDLVAYPSSPKAVSDSAKLKLVLSDSEALAQAICDYQDTSDLDAKQKRRFRNAIFGIAPAKTMLDDAIQVMRQQMAATEIKDEQGKNKAVKEQIEGILPNLSKRARIRAVRAFNRVVFQGKPSVTLDEKYLVPEEGALQDVNGQDRLKTFLDDNKLIFQPTDAVDIDLLLDYIVKGATPSLDHGDAYPASAVHERALASDKLRLMLSPDPVRKSILKAVEQGKLIVRLPNGDIYDKDGSVSNINGARQRTTNRLHTLQLNSDVSLAPLTAKCVQGWLQVDDAVEEGKDGETDGGAGGYELDLDTAYADTWDDAITHAQTRPLRALKLKSGKIDAAKTLAGLAQPFGAKSLTLSVIASGVLKDGGNINFAASNLKHNHPLKPLETVATLLRAMADGASFEAELNLDFGESGLTDSGSKLQQASQSASDEVGLNAEFGKETK